MVIASLVKEFQLASELNHMKGIVPDDILEALKKKKLGLPGIDIEAPVEKNAMMAGEFEVIMELMAAYADKDQAKIAKAQVSIFNIFMFFFVGLKWCAWPNNLVSNRLAHLPTLGRQAHRFGSSPTKRNRCPKHPRMHHWKQDDFWCFCWWVASVLEKQNHEQYWTVCNIYNDCDLFTR